MVVRYRDAAGEIRSRAAIQLRKRISEHVGDLWVEIAERLREFAGMEFDSYWQCWLVRKDGKHVTSRQGITRLKRKPARYVIDSDKGRGKPQIVFS
jgi:hypothetical protein